MRSLLLLYCCIFVFNSWAQQPSTPLSAWIFPNIEYSSSKRVVFRAQYGFNNYLQANAIYLQASFQVGKYLVLNPGYFGLWIGGHYLNIITPAISFRFAIGQFVIDERNLLWEPFGATAGSPGYFRNRIRLTWQPGKVPGQFKLYLFDEAWYMFEKGNWRRNRIASGLSYDIKYWLNLDLAIALEQDRYTGRTNLIFIQGAISLHKNRRAEAR